MDLMAQTYACKKASERPSIQIILNWLKSGSGRN